MHRRLNALPQKLYVLIDVVIFLLCSLIPYAIYYNWETFPRLISFPHMGEYLMVFMSQLVAIVLTFLALHLYSTTREWDYLYEQAIVLLGLLIAAAFSGSIIFLSRFDLFSRLIFLVEFLILYFALGGWRVIKRMVLRRMIAKGYKNINVLLIGQNNQTGDYISKIKASPQLGINLVGYLNDNEIPDIDPELPWLGSLPDFEKVCHTYFVENVIIMNQECLNVDNSMIDKVTDMGIGIGVIPSSIDIMPPLMSLEQLDDIPVLHYKFKEFSPLDSVAKRVFDIIFAALAIIVLCPLFLTIIMVIKITSRGPVVFVQKRVGIKGIEFNFYKFRSMVINAEELKKQLEDCNEVKDGVIFKMKNDPRVTRFGRFIRKYSLDELPQLFNVLKGDMSIVGPRPPLMSEVVKYRHDQMVRLKVRPGLTGLPQIRGRSNLAFSEWVKWDLWYIRNWSLLLDLRIVLSTIPAVFKGDGAY